MIGSSMMFYVQQSGYKISSVYKHLLIMLRENILNIFMLILIIVCMIELKLNWVYFAIPYLLIEVCLWLWAGNQFEFISKINYTKRMQRQIIFYLVLIVIFTILLLKIDYYYLAIGLPIVYIFYYVIYSLVLIILLPVEKLIGLHFIISAKKKLSSNPKLIKIGITGSYGKTSTKEILYSILSKEYFVLATPKSYNTPFGISKTINQELRNSHEIFVCEMGAKKRGEINELCKLVNVDCGIVTAVGRQHLETFGSIEGVYKTKKELPDYLYQKLCVFNLMNYYVASMYKDYLYSKIGVFLLIKRLGVINVKPKVNLKNKIKLKPKTIDLIKLKFYEFVKENNVYAKNIKITSVCSEFEIWKDKRFICTAETELIGIHNIINILLSVAMALNFGVSSKSIKQGIKSIKNIKARFEKIYNQNGAVIINNGYNSNLDSAVYSLKALSLFDNKNKLVVTPGLIECKDMYEDNYKFGKLVGKYATEVIVVKRTNRDAIIEGLNSIKFNKSKIYVVDDFESAKRVLQRLTKDYVVLIENDLPENYK